MNSLYFVQTFVVGVPATVMDPPADNRADSVIVAETVQALITLMDTLKLNQRAKDEIHPYVEQVVTSLAKVRGLPSDFDGLVKMKLWLQKLNDLRAYDEIEESEARQFTFDVDAAYSAFRTYLSSHS